MVVVVVSPPPSARGRMPRPSRCVAWKCGTHKTVKARTWNITHSQGQIRLAGKSCRNFSNRSLFARAYAATQPCVACQGQKRSLTNPHEFSRILTNPHSQRIYMNPLDSTRILTHPHKSVRTLTNPHESSRIPSNPNESSRVLKNPHKSVRIYESSRIFANPLEPQRILWGAIKFS